MHQLFGNLISKFAICCSDSMSLIVRKPVFWVSNQVPHKQGCRATQDGQRLEISLICVFVSAYAKCWFSHDAAQTCFCPCKHQRHVSAFGSLISKFAICCSASRKQVCVMKTPYTQLLHKKNWGLPGYTFFSYFCTKTLIVGTR